MGIFICFNSLIIGYSLKNARELNRSKIIQKTKNYLKNNKIDIGETCNGSEAPIQADIVATSLESVPGTTLIVYMIFNTLFCLLGAK